MKEIYLNDSILNELAKPKSFTAREKVTLIESFSLKFYAQADIILLINIYDILKNIRYLALAVSKYLKVLHIIFLLLHIY